MQAMAGGAEVVFWGSAYGGGNPLRSAAMMHNYAIVSSGCKTRVHCWRLGCILPRATATIARTGGEFIGSNGVDIPPSLTTKPQPDATVRFATVDLDAVMVNFNSGGSALPALIKNGTLEVDWLDEATQSWRVVSKKPG